MHKAVWEDNESAIRILHEHGASVTKPNSVSGCMQENEDIKAKRCTSTYSHTSINMYGIL